MAYNLYQVQMARAWQEVSRWAVGTQNNELGSSGPCLACKQQCLFALPQARPQPCSPMCCSLLQRIEKENAQAEAFWAKQAMAGTQQLAGKQGGDAASVAGSHVSSAAPTGYTSKTSVGAAAHGSASVLCAHLSLMPKCPCLRAPPSQP